MNRQMARAIKHIKSIKNPQIAAMQSLQNAANQGNPMAKNILENIQSGNMQGAEETLNNMMGEQGVSLDEIKEIFR